MDWTQISIFFIFLLYSVSAADQSSLLNPFHRLNETNRNSNFLASIFGPEGSQQPEGVLVRVFPVQEMGERGLDVATLRNEAYTSQNCLRQIHGVNPLQTDSRLEASSQGWADHLSSTGEFQHSDSGHGENLFGSSRLVHGWDAIEAWYGESSNYPYGDSSPGAAGHFTQLVWKGSDKCGISFSQGAQWTVVVAQYQPPGNVIGQFGANVLPPVQSSAGAKPNCFPDSSTSSTSGGTDTTGPASVPGSQNPPPPSQPSRPPFPPGQGQPSGSPLPPGQGQPSGPPFPPGQGHPFDPAYPQGQPPGSPFPPSQGSPPSPPFLPGQGLPSYPPLLPGQGQPPGSLPPGQGLLSRPQFPSGQNQVSNPPFPPSQPSGPPFLPGQGLPSYPPFLPGQGQPSGSLPPGQGQSSYPPYPPDQGQPSGPPFLPGEGEPSYPPFLPDQGPPSGPQFPPGQGESSYPPFPPGQGQPSRPPFLPGESEPSYPPFLPDQGPPSGPQFPPGQGQPSDPPFLPGIWSSKSARPAT